MPDWPQATANNFRVHFYRVSLSLEDKARLPQGCVDEADLWVPCPDTFFVLCRVMSGRVEGGAL